MPQDSKELKPQDEFEIKTSTVETLCKAVGIPYIPYEEKVHFGHGGEHHVVPVGGTRNFYVDIDQLRGETKVERMQNALDILRQLGSHEAFQSIVNAGVLERSSKMLDWSSRQIYTLAKTSPMAANEQSRGPFHQCFVDGTIQSVVKTN